MDKVENVDKINNMSKNGQNGHNGQKLPLTDILKLYKYSLYQFFWIRLKRSYEQA